MGAVQENPGAGHEAPGASQGGFELPAVPVSGHVIGHLRQKESKAYRPVILGHLLLWLHFTDGKAEARYKETTSPRLHDLSPVWSQNPGLLICAELLPLNHDAGTSLVIRG